VSKSRNLFVPAGAFLVAVVLSILTGPPPFALARRAPQQETGGCKTDLTNVDAELSAKKWDPVNPGKGELKISGKYDTQFNTVFWSGFELAGLRMTLKVLDLLDGGPGCSSESFGTVQNAGKKATKQSADDNDVQKESFKIGKGDGFTFSDGADLNKAIANAARKIAIAGGCDQSLDGVLSKIDPASETALRAKLQKEVSVTLGIHWGGTLHDNATPCPKRWHGEVKKMEIDDKGKEKKTPFVPLPPGSPGGLLPPAQQ